MIIAPKFDGDDWLELQRAQHDTYGEALRILVERCRIAFKNAVVVTAAFDDPIYDTLLVMSDRIDHRTMQNAHDHLAAAWRKKNRFVQPDLFVGQNMAELAREWLLWLRKEVDQWLMSRPGIVRLVCLVLVQQNVKGGYQAEDELLEALRRHYPLTDA